MSTEETLVVNRREKNNGGSGSGNGSVSSSKAPLQNKQSDETVLDSSSSANESTSVKFEEKKGVGLHFKQVPYFLRESFMHGGYRNRLTFMECIKSLFVMHNETINIWTAIIPLCVLCSLWIYTAFYWQGEGVTWGCRAVFLVYLSGAIHSFLASTLFHTFGSAMTEFAHDMLIRFDYSGIATLIAASFFPPLYYIFYCNPWIRNFYLTTISVLACIGGGLIMVPGDQKELRKLRVIVLASTAMFGFVPTIHFMVSCGFPAPITRQVLYIAGMYLSYGTGLFFYVSKIPEKLYPGRFDHYGHSHQWWHVWVTTATFLHYFGCLHAMQLNQEYECFQSIADTDNS